MTYFPEVVQAVPGEGYTVYAYFTDGSIRLVNFAPLIDGGGVFAPLADPRYFRERLTVLNGSVAWDVSGNHDPTECIDLDPLEIWRGSEIVPDPLEKRA